MTTKPIEKSLDYKPKEFNLGEKKECVAVFGNQFMVYPEKDVKEFISKEENLIHLLLNKLITQEQFWNERDKLAGDELK